MDNWKAVMGCQLEHFSGNYCGKSTEMDSFSHFPHLSPDQRLIDMKGTFLHDNYQLLPYHMVSFTNLQHVPIV